MSLLSDIGALLRILFVFSPIWLWWGWHLKSYLDDERADKRKFQEAQRQAAIWNAERKKVNEDGNERPQHREVLEESEDSARTQ